MIRMMTAEDLPQVLVIERASFTAPFSERMFREELEHPIAHLAVEVPEDSRDEILGYIVWWHVYDEIHVVNVAVREVSRRRGIATRLINTMLNEGRADAARFVYLEVRRTNAAAQAMYEKFGFRVFGVRKGYYHDNNEDAVLMGLDL